MNGKMSLTEIKLSDLRVSANNVRKEDAEVNLDGLIANIKDIGLQQPIVVVKNGNKYDIIVGQRRYLAAKKMGWDTIPARILENIETTQAKVISFSENIHRLDLSYSDKMHVTLSLLESNDNNVKKVAGILGVSEATIRNYLGYSAVPVEVKQLVEAHKMSAAQAIRITQAFEDETKVAEIARKMLQFTRSDDKRRFVQMAKNSPDEPVEKIAKHIADTRPITIYLSDNVWNYLSKEAKNSQLDIEDIASIAVEEWVGRRA